MVEVDLAAEAGKERTRFARVAFSLLPARGGKMFA